MVMKTDGIYHLLFSSSKGKNARTPYLELYKILIIRGSRIQKTSELKLITLFTLRMNAAFSIFSQSRRCTSEVENPSFKASKTLFP